jgi:peroxiredoxin
MSTPLLVSYVALWLVVGLQTLVLLGLTHALHAQRQEGGPVQAAAWRGRRVPAFRAVGIGGETVAPDTLAGRPSVLLFVSPNCPTCIITRAEVHVLARNPDRQLVVVCRADDEDSRRFAARHELTGPVVADEDGELSGLFDVNSPPTAVRVDAEGIVESYGRPVRSDELEALEAESEVVS